MSKIETPYDNVISELFEKRWTADLSHAPIEKKRAQLYKTLRDQSCGYWSGHSAYHLALHGGFLIDGKSNTFKKLTAIGVHFMGLMNPNWKDEVSETIKARSNAK